MGNRELIQSTRMRRPSMARARHRGITFRLAIPSAWLGFASAACASLDAALSFSAATVNVGQGVVVTLTVTNTGVSDANNIFPQIFVAGPAVVTAPTPLTVPVLTAGSLTTFQWTLSPTAGGSIAVTANATAD